MTTIEHDGRLWLVLKASDTSFDGLPDFDVCCLEVTRQVLDGWMSRLAIVDGVRAQHGATCVTFDDCTPHWRASDCESDPIDADGDIQRPIWDADLPRSEGDVLEVGAGYLEWQCRPKHGDTLVVATLWRSDLPAVEAALAAFTASQAVQA